LSVSTWARFDLSRDLEFVRTRRSRSARV